MNFLVENNELRAEENEAAIKELAEVLAAKPGSPQEQAEALVGYFHAQWDYNYVEVQRVEDEHPTKIWTRHLVLLGKTREVTISVQATS